MTYEDCNAAGGMTAYNREHDPKRLAFQAARYKHVAKLLEGKRRVLEVGCADGFYSIIVRQHVGSLDAIDADRNAIEIAWKNASRRWPIEFFPATLKSMVGFERPWDAVYSLDVFEHVPPEDEDQFLGTMRKLAGECVIGTPSLESQAYASEISRREHVNCVTKAGLRERMGRHWRHVFVLGMNDETLHTGFDGMTQYLLGIGCD